MSTVTLPESYKSKLTLEYLRSLADTWNIKFGSDEEAGAYLLLLQSTEYVHDMVSKEADYIHPDLMPVATIETRQFRRPAGNENPNNAWSHFCNIQAAEPTSSLLKGKSIAFKDNISVGGLPTTVGAFPSFFSGDGGFPVSPVDASVVRRALEAGATLKGTATCEMYSASPLSFTSASGPVHNAWAHGFTSGGSSSGCASLVGMSAVDPDHKMSMVNDRVDLAVGGDQGGSVRVPAAYNGIYGLKPTHGLVPYTGATGLVPMVDHLGPIASNLKDIATLLQVMAGYDGLDPRMTPESPLRQAVPDYSAVLGSLDITRASKGLRVGLIKESFDIPGVSEEVRSIVRDSALRDFTAAGAVVEEVSVPMHLLGAMIWTASTRMDMADWACANHWSGFLSHQPPHIDFKWPPDQDMYDKLSATNPSVVNIIFSAKFLQDKYSPSLLSKAHRKVFELRQAYDDALSRFDVLVTPTTPTVAMPHPDMSNFMDRIHVAVGIVANTCPFNVTGHPAISVPCGFGKASIDGVLKELPVGMQLISRRWDEVKLLGAAAIFEHGRDMASK